MIRSGAPDMTLTPTPCQSQEQEGKIQPVIQIRSAPSLSVMQFLKPPTLCHSVSQHPSYPPSSVPLKAIHSSSRSHQQTPFVLKNTTESAMK
mmetsp:Transcript_25732/g.40892  ORF Transcript_25732/g.40892 Transcript_25732/m.40892 type:complete len:92 (+) Transcript_25732:1119-1394(+)